MDRIRVLLVDDQLLFRKGLRALLEDRPEFEVIGEATDGRQALDMVEAMTPDVVLMDLNMPVCDGVEATRMIKTDFPSTRVVILTVSDEDELEALRTETTPVSDVLSSIR